MQFNRILTALAAVVVSAVTTTGAIAPAAAAGGGEVIYSSRTGPTESTLLVCEDWGVSSCQRYHWFRIKFGESSKQYVQDADGFYVPSYCNAYVGSSAYAPNRWVKIGDATRARVELNCW